MQASGIYEQTYGEKNKDGILTKNDRKRYQPYRSFFNCFSSSSQTKRVMSEPKVNRKYLKFRRNYQRGLITESAERPFLKWLSKRFFASSKVTLLYTLS